MRSPLRHWHQLLLIPFVLACAALSRADEATVKALTEALSKFTLPEMPAELKQKLRDYVPNDLKRRRDEGNAKSSAEWKAIDDKEEWEAFRNEKLKKLQYSLGLSFQKDDWKPPKLPESPVNAGAIKGEGYRIDKLIYRSAYGQWITANLYVPEPTREKMPGFIISHAHHTPKEHGELQDMGVLWARAGCYVLVPDHLGHGERRQHPFKSKDDYEKPFQVSRQDYYFRYDVNLQLNIVGESLMGCLALDLMSGVSLLLDLPSIDKDKIIMLGAVAGGGDPCAVAAALDERVTCAAPFNFGGPQPENKYPLPEDSETSFNYGGGGGWESTRNLAFSYRDGFLPWVIVGSIAPRRLIYGHEFSWDRERDPVWKRFEKIYGFYDKPDNLSFATGYGTIQVNDPPGSHCTHIGKPHRKKIHEALAKWFEIKLPGGEESTDRHETAELRCWTEELRGKFKDASLTVAIQKQWKETDDNSSDNEIISGGTVSVEWQGDRREFGVTTHQQIVLKGKDRLIPILVFDANVAPAKNKPAVLVVCRAGKQEFVRLRAETIAQLLDAGISVALPDLYSTGLTGGDDFSRRSGATGRASTLAMHGMHLTNEHSRDIYHVLDWLDKARGWASEDRIALWCDSLVPPNDPTKVYRIPRDDDSVLPHGPDPLPELVARKFAVRAVYVRGGLDSQRSALMLPLILLPQDCVPLPGKSQITSTWKYLQHDPDMPLALRRDEVVDALNRPAEQDPGDHDPRTAAEWVVKQLSRKSK